MRLTYIIRENSRNVRKFPIRGSEGGNVKTTCHSSPAIGWGGLSDKDIKGGRRQRKYITTIHDKKPIFE